MRQYLGSPLRTQAAAQNKLLHKVLMDTSSSQVNAEKDKETVLFEKTSFPCDSF